MILAIDIGNTLISFGVLENGKIRTVLHVETGLPKKKLAEGLAKTLKTIDRKFPQLEDVVICSVVPAVLAATESAVYSVWKNTPLVIGRDIKVPLINRYRNPKQVGQDRLVCAYAAMRLYGVPVIVVDLGTAITLELVSPKKEYLGGIIVPGIKMTTESLFQKTALLPRTKIREPKSIIGKDTEGSILSGIFFGYGAMIRGLVDMVKKEFRIRPKVVVTGGYAAVMNKYVRQADAIDTALVFKGIELIWQEGRGCSCCSCPC